MGPDADTGEKVALGKSAEVVRCDIFNTPFVNFARGDMPGGYEVTQLLRREWVDLVVVSCRAHAASRVPIRFNSASDTVVMMCRGVMYGRQINRSEPLGLLLRFPVTDAGTN